MAVAESQAVPAVDAKSQDVPVDLALLHSKLPSLLDQEMFPLVESDLEEDAEVASAAMILEIEARQVASRLSLFS